MKARVRIDDPCGIPPARKTRRSRTADWSASLIQISAPGRRPLISQVQREVIESNGTWPDVDQHPHEKNPAEAGFRFYL